MPGYWMLWWGIVVLVVAAVVWWRWRVGRAVVARHLREDALKHLAKAEANKRRPTMESVAGAIGIRRAKAARLLAGMEADGLVGFVGGDLCLLEPGRDMAVHLVRAHRLWESYLAEKTGFPAQDWHGEADKIEHMLSPDAAAALAAKLGNPTHDPHGDPIPEDPGRIAADYGQPLADLAMGSFARIVHMEDEPRALFSELLKLGLRPGQSLEVLAKSTEGLHIRLPGEELTLAPILANNVFVVPLPAIQAGRDLEESTLARLGDGGQARVAGLSPACRGAERRRLLDLGFVPGSVVSVAMVSPGGDPTAYRVRGCLIALRREQAAMIRTTSTGESAA